MSIQKLRDMNLGAVADELEELRAYKEAAEKQEPSCYVVIVKGISFYASTLEEAEHRAAALVWRSEETPTIRPLYANPVPADKPVTRQDVIDVLLSTSGQSEGVTADAILGLLPDKVTVPVPDAIKLLQRVAAGTTDKPAVAVPDGWNIVTSENWNIPKVGQRVILFSNGVIQEESYTLDQADGEPGCSYYFWSRDDLDECPEVKVGDMWMPWPSSAAPSHSQQGGGHDWDDQDKCKKCGDRDWYAGPVCNGKSSQSADLCQIHESEEQ